MKIRHATLADCAAIARMHRQTIRTVNKKDYPPEIIDNWARNTAKKMRDSHNICIRYVAEDDGKIIGFGDIMKHDGNLGGIYIHKDWIGKGVGSKLLSMLEADARKLGARVFRFSASITAKPFYESKGYYLLSPKKEIHRHVNGKPFYIYQMGKDLVPLEDWERALWKFLYDWQGRKDVLAAVLGGSYAHGTQTSNSDIDVHIILSDDVHWRVRGDTIVDGYLVEYFANPVRQLNDYLEGDWKDGSHADARMFSTGRVLFDKTGITKTLRANANKDLKRKFAKLSKDEINIAKYCLWYNLDNLRDLHTAKSPAFNYEYHRLLHEVLSVYRRYLGAEVAAPSKLYKFFTDAKWRKRYHIRAFPDSIFAKLFVLAMKEAKLKNLEKVIQHVVAKMGGFEIDGWKHRSKPTL